MVVICTLHTFTFIHILVPSGSLQTSLMSYVTMFYGLIGRIHKINAFQCSLFHNSAVAPSTFHFDRITCFYYPCTTMQHYLQGCYVVFCAINDVVVSITVYKSFICLHRPKSFTKLNRIKIQPWFFRLECQIKQFFIAHE